MLSENASFAGKMHQHLLLLCIVFFSLIIIIDYGSFVSPLLENKITININLKLSKLVNYIFKVLKHFFLSSNSNFTRAGWKVKIL